MDEAQAQAIRQWVMDRIALSIDNDQAALDHVQEMAREAVRDDQGSTTLTLDEYRRAHRDGATDDMAATIGNRVADYIGELLDERITDDFMRTMVSDVFDLADSTFRRMLGAHYLPDPDDMADYLDEEDEEEEEDDASRAARQMGVGPDHPSHPRHW